MFKRTAVTLSTLLFAFAILFVSILRTASVKYEFSGISDGAYQEEKVLGEDTERIHYNLAYPGRILPDHPLWGIKALRDRIWLAITTSPTRKAELKLLFADKRVGMSKVLFEKGKPGEGFSTLTKAEKYLEEAMLQEKQNRASGIDTTEFLKTLSMSSLKHREVIEEILTIAPDEAKPKIIQTSDYSKKVYEETMHALNEKGFDALENPFDGQ